MAGGRAARRRRLRVTYGPYVTQNRKEGPYMSRKRALRADLDAEDRKTLAEDRKRMERLGKFEHSRPLQVPETPLPSD